MEKLLKRKQESRKRRADFQQESQKGSSQAGKNEPWFTKGDSSKKGSKKRNKKSGSQCPSSNFSEAGYHEVAPENVDAVPPEEKKFLPIPSLGAGLCLGLNNFLLGLIADQGISSLYIFSVGALIMVTLYRTAEACIN